MIVITYIRMAYMEYAINGLQLVLLICEKVLLAVLISPNITPELNFMCINIAYDVAYIILTVHIKFSILSSF